MVSQRCREREMHKRRKSERKWAGLRDMKTWRTRKNCKYWGSFQSKFLSAKSHKQLWPEICVGKRTVHLQHFFFFFPSFFLTMFIEVKWTAQERGPKFPLCPESDYSFGRHGGTNKHKLNAKAETWSSFFSSNNSFQKYAESQNPSYLSNCGSTLTVRNLRLYLTLALVWSSDLGSWIISTITSITRGLSPYARRHFLNEKCGSIF